jgi:uncharacterized protein YcbK (DUF882 family)
MGDLRKNFSRAEFACNHCGALRGPTEALLDVLQRMRDVKGKPMTIVSGYRCPTYNRHVGGIVTSEHLLGNAADVIGGYASARQWHAAGAIGVGIRHSRVIHVDCARRMPFTFQDN